MPKELDALNNNKYIQNNTDCYFSKTKQIVNEFGDKNVVYAFFLRKPSIYAPKLVLNFLENAINFNKIKIHSPFSEGDLVGAGEPLFYLEGSFKLILELETLILQKIGIPAICAWNAYKIAKEMPNVSFISMIARHCVNPDMVYMCEYGASVANIKLKNEGAIGFIGCSTKNNIDLFNIKEPYGTMPHALIGYAGSTLESTKMYHKTFNPSILTVLPDYFAKEISDTLEVCNYFKEMAKKGQIIIRLDTHGGRFQEGLDHEKSHEIIEKYAPKAYLRYQDAEDLKYLHGMGVSIASIFNLREHLDKNNFHNVKIMASSGFNLKKCILAAYTKAPINFIGTGSYMPEYWSDSFATADIVEYDNIIKVKKGREFLIKKWKNFKNNIK